MDIQSLGFLGETAYQVVDPVPGGIEIAVFRASTRDEGRVRLAVEPVATGRRSDDGKRMRGSLRCRDIAAHTACRYAQMVGQLARRDPAV